MYWPTMAQMSQVVVPKIAVKNAYADPIGFFQSCCDFGSEEIIKNVPILFIMVLTTINNYNRPLLELQRQFIFCPVFG